MSILGIALREIRCRKLNFGLMLAAVVVAVAALSGAVTSFKAYDLETTRVLEAKEAETAKRLTVLKDEMRKTTLKLSFNLLILPKDQQLRDWYADDYAAKYMPEEYVTRLANSGIVTVRHFLPSLQQKVQWPEKKRTIILVGSRGEVPNPHKNPRKPLVQPVPPGTIVLGHELHRTLGIKEGDHVTLMGSDFKVHRCHAERGSKDDITAWIHLSEAQELLDRKGQINAILALECLCAGKDDFLAKLRKEIGAILPETQVIEKGTRALARAESRFRVGREAKQAVEAERQGRARLRRERERIAGFVVPPIILGSVICVSLLGFGNTRERKREIGVLRAVGWRTGQILSLFLAKLLVVGLVGGSVGFVAGSALGGAGAGVPGQPGLLLASVIAAVVLTVASGWIPALLASLEDPARTLRSDRE